MERSIDILIDASGSMGYMKGSDNENKYLLQDNSTRTSLVKKIINESLLHNLSFADSINFSYFRNTYEYDAKGNRKKKYRSSTINGIQTKKYYYPMHHKLVSVYKGVFDKEIITKAICSIKDPEIGGTPLRWALAYAINNAKQKLDIIVLSDGDANDKENFDQEILELIESLKKDVTIHFVGIAQDKSAQIKSKNLAEKTGGIYVNLKAMDYDKSRLDILLSKLNTKIVSKALEENTETLQDNIPKNKEQQNENNGIKLEQQVKQNTSSLKLISGQLANIINLLHARENIENEIEVVDNEIYNKRIGRQAEQILCIKLKDLFSDKNTEVIWLNEKEEQGLAYDFKIIKENKIFYYECKGTSSELLEFQLTKKEWEFYLNNKGNYRLCFVKNVDKKSKYTRFMNLLEDMDNKLLTPCSTQNKAYKANRLIFSINNSKVKWI